MRRLTSLVAVLLLLLMAAPGMACLTDQSMSHSGSACCRMMQGKCGDMVEQSCCRTEIRTQDPLLAAQSPDLKIHWVTPDVAVVPFVSAPMTVPAGRLSAEQGSPPKPRPTKPIVLRL